MRFPNGYGGVSKISGNRRRPWRARITAGYVYVDKETGKEVTNPDPDQLHHLKARQKYLIIGYYATRKEALNALTSYNDDPYDLRKKKITFAEIYDRWSKEFFPTVSDSNVKGVKASYPIFADIYSMPICDITVDHLQACIDKSGKNEPLLKKAKVMLNKMFKWAAAHEIINSDKLNILTAINIKKGNPHRVKHKRFTKAEIKTLWAHKDNEIVSIILMMIYSGVRVSELIELQKRNVHLDKRCFYIDHAKTEAGIRWVPIADKVYDFFDMWMHRNPQSEMLITGLSSGECIGYSTFRDCYWDVAMSDLHMSHLPHDTRYTCITLMTEAGADDRVIKQIVGHAGNSVTEKVYTQIDIDYKLKAINLI